MRSTIFVFTLLLITSLGLFAQTVVVNPDQYFVDHDLRLVLVNQPAADLNSQSSGELTSLNVNGEKSLSAPVTELEIGTPYSLDWGNGEIYTLYLTELPVIRIDPSQEIVDEPRRLADFTLTEPDGSALNSLLGVEYRGGYSQNYPKKSFRLELWDDEYGDETRKEALLGMREDDDWNLNANYNEPLRIRNHVSWQIWQEMHQPYYQDQEEEARSHIRGVFTELFVGDEYRGLYQLTERMDRKQLQIKKPDEDGSPRGRIYKGVDHGNTRFSSLPPLPPSGEERWGGWLSNYPDEAYDDFTELYELTEFIRQSDQSTFLAELPERMEYNTLIDYFLFLNLTRATDNTGKNTHLVRFNAGEPLMYVPWDLDGVFGTDWQGIYNGWPEGYLRNCLYDRLLADCDEGGFLEQLTQRWEELRESGLMGATGLFQRFATTAGRLEENGVYAREKMAWSDFVLPSATELDQVETFINQRISWLDANMPPECATSNTETPSAESAVDFFPNPAGEQLTLNWSIDYAATGYQLLDVNGRVVIDGSLADCDSSKSIDLGALAKGVYLLRVLDESGRGLWSGRLIKQ